MPLTVADQLTDSLTPYLGPHTARNAVRLFSRRALSKEPGDVTRSEAPALVDALRPMLRTLVGDGPTERLLDELRSQLRP